MKHFFPNPYLLGIGMTLLALTVIWGIKFILSQKTARFFKHDHNKWDEIVVFAVEKTKLFFMLLASLYIGFKFIPHSKKFGGYVDKAFFIILMWQIWIWAHHLLEKWIARTIRQKTKKNPAVASSMSLIQLFSRVILFSVIFLFTLSNLDIKITTIVAGLGVGGIAVALALQKILGDLFASLSIALDKPFIVGDFIVIDGFLGEVEKIGLKTTRIRSLGGEQIIFSNSDLLGTRIRNYKRMYERRVLLHHHLPLQITTERLKTAVSIISAIVRTKHRVRFERCHFMKITTTVEVETVYWVLSDDYDMHMDIQQDILFDIKNAFESEGITFAYPTQTIQVLPTELIMRNPESMSPESRSQPGTIIS